VRGVSASPTAAEASAARARSLPGRRVALVHHWALRRRGGEKALEALARLLPGAALFTLLHDPRGYRPPPEVGAVHASRLRHLPGASRWFRALLPLFPWLYAGLDLSGHDVVVTSDASVAKTVRVPEGAVHVCYCYSPVRYAWDLREVYLASLPAPLRPPARAALAWVRRADARGAARVDAFLAISEHVAARIERCYGRPSRIVHPPVDVAYFTPGGPPPGPDAPYLLFGEAVPYKRFDVAVDACRRLDRPLVVAGGGPGFARLADRAGPRARFVRRPSDEQARTLYRGCRALLFPGEEDFGIVPVEAQACGRPVVALGVGGATETVVDGVTGVLYEGAGSDALVAAMLRFEEIEGGLSPGDAVAQARRFGEERFAEAMRRALDAAVAGARAEGHHPPPAR